MRRLIVLLLVVLGLLAAATPAEARWGCHWGGWGGYGCYRGCGWGGYYGGYYPRYCGFGGYGGYGLGYGLGYGRYVGFYGPSYYYPAYRYPFINIGYPYYNYGGYGYGLYGSNYSTPTSVGYYATTPATSYNANANFLSSLPQPRSPISTNVSALTLQQFLDLRGEVAPANMLSESTLPKMSGRISSVDSRQRAMRYLAEGDTLFQAQNFNSALQKYKLAAGAAPELAEAYWRQGHALVATKNFDLATTAFKRAIANSTDLGRGGFRLDDIYGGASLTKAGHLENLAALAMNRHNDADAYFLIGLFLNYDGQAERAEKFFDRASDLAGIGGGHIALFLNQDKAPPVVAGKTPPPPKPALFTSASGLEI